MRDAPSTEELRRAFRLKVDRKQRHSDGTISIGAIRFEVPNAYRHLDKLTVRYARWDLSSADLWDDSLGVVLATLYPVDREKNASGRWSTAPTSALGAGARTASSAGYHRPRTTAAGSPRRTTSRAAATPSNSCERGPSAGVHPKAADRHHRGPGGLVPQKADDAVNTGHIQR